MLSYKNHTRNENSFALTAFFFEYNYKVNYCFVEHCYFLCVQCAVIVDVDIVFYINKPERYGYEIFRFVFFFYNVVVEKQMSEQLIWLLFYKVIRENFFFSLQKVLLYLSTKRNFMEETLHLYINPLSRQFLTSIVKALLFFKFV